MSKGIKISLCIPTFNRAKHLKNCLNSIISVSKTTKFNFQVCVSDNNSNDNTTQIVQEAKKQIDIKYHKNSINLGIPRNFINVVNMAEGEFIWLVGDDDLVLDYSLIKLTNLIEQNPDVDFFYVNSFHLSTEHVFSFPQPFNTNDLPSYMEPFSKFKNDGKLNFMDLINPEISFDFLGGMYLSVFKRKNWIESVYIIDDKSLISKNIFSHFDNTFPQIKIFSKAFSKSKAYFNSNPLIVSLTGAREWAPMYPFIRSVRLIEALNEYKKNGLSSYNYHLCRNYALRTFIPDLAWMVLNYKNSGIQYIKPVKHIFSNIFYPNMYMSIFYYIRRKILNLK